MPSAPSSKTEEVTVPGKKIFEGQAYVSLNDIALAGEGGRVVLHCLDSELPKDHQQVEVILNLRTDEAMTPFPETARDRTKKRFRVVVYEDGDMTEVQRGQLSR